MRLCLSAVVVVACLGGLCARGVPAQRGGTPSRSAPRPSPPPSAAAYATARARQGEHARARYAQARRQARARDDDTEEAARPRKRRKKEKLPRKPADAFARAKYSRIFKSSLEEIAGRIRTQSYWAEVTLLASSGRTARYRVAFTGVRREGGRQQYRLSVFRRGRGGDVLERRILVHETPGRRASGWVAARHAVRPAAGNPLLLSVIEGWTLRVVDVIPFEPARYRLAFKGLGVRDGQEVAVFKGAMSPGIGARLSMAFTRDHHLLLRVTHTVGGRVRRIRQDSGLGRHGRLRLLDCRRFLLAGGRETAVVRIRGRRLNGTVDPFHFNPSTFERDGP